MPSQVILQEFAPPHVMRAGLDTVSWLCVYARNKSLDQECKIKEMNDLMEAVHHVRMMLMSWNPNRMRELRNHLGCFNPEYHPEAPDFVAYFDRRLEDYRYAETLLDSDSPHPPD